MKIKFKKGDPREGMVAEFNSSRGRELVEAGAAEEVRAGGSSKAEAVKEAIFTPNEVRKMEDAKPAKKAKKKAD